MTDNDKITEAIEYLKTSGKYGRAFPKPNHSLGFVCPVCNTSADVPVVLVSIPSTYDDGICEAIQVHEECAALVAKMGESP